MRWNSRKTKRNLTAAKFQSNKVGSSRIYIKMNIQSLWERKEVVPPPGMLYILKTVKLTLAKAHVVERENVFLKIPLFCVHVCVCLARVIGRSRKEGVGAKLLDRSRRLEIRNKNASANVIGARLARNKNDQGTYIETSTLAINNNRYTYATKRRKNIKKEEQATMRIESINNSVGWRAVSSAWAGAPVIVIITGKKIDKKSRVAKKAVVKILMEERIGRGNGITNRS